MREFEAYHRALRDALVEIELVLQFYFDLDDPNESDMMYQIMSDIYDRLGELLTDAFFESVGQ